MCLKAVGPISVPAAAHTPSLAFWHLPPNSARIGYTTEGALLLISKQLSTDAIIALRKVWLRIRLEATQSQFPIPKKPTVFADVKQHSTNTHVNTGCGCVPWAGLTKNNPEKCPCRKKLVQSQLKRFWFYLCWCILCGHLQKKRSIRVVFYKLTTI